MVLRQTSKVPKLFSVIDPAFVYGLDDCVALLGPLPWPWIVQAAALDMEDMKFHNTQTGYLSEEDPRLGPLSPDWRRVSKGLRTGDDPVTFQRFVNTRTGEMITHDPRLDRDALIARGVVVRNFTLV